ncbi:MAG: SgcJ/EcaC family oxidoreductase [Acidobacteriota bacterium]
MIKAAFISILFLPFTSFCTAYAQEVPPPYEELPEFVTIGEPASEADYDAVRKLLTTSAAAWGQGDAKSLSSAYGEDAEWMNAFGQIRRGSEAIRAYLSDLFEDQDDEMAEFEQQSGAAISLRFIGDDVAIFHGVTRSTRMGALEGAEERRVHSTTVMEKRGDRWLVVHEHISDARPAVE